jgi:hypothetical protein
MKIGLMILAILLASPASAKVYVLQWGSTYEVWETRGLYDYPVVSGVKTEREARDVVKGLRRGKR